MSIKNIEVPADQLSYDSALVVWETDPGEENTYDGVKFGIGALDQDTGESLDADGDTSHMVLLSNLQPATTYRVQPHSRVNGARSGLGFDSGDGTLSITTAAEPVAQAGMVSRVSLTADRHLVRAGHPVRFTVKVSGSGGSLAGKAIAMSALNGHPRLDPQGAFVPAAPVTGADPGNSCDVTYTPGRRGLAWIIAKVDGVTARFGLVVLR